jgi:hypothetical protein
MSVHGTVVCLGEGGNLLTVRRPVGSPGGTTTTLESPTGRVPTSVARDGMVPTSVASVPTSVSAAGCVGVEASADGMPVMTPRESVRVVKAVMVLE